MHVTAGKKCQYIGNCTFAHSVEERDLWTYMKENNSEFWLADCPHSSHNVALRKETQLYLSPLLVPDMDQLYEQWLQSQKPGWGEETSSNSVRENGKQIHMPTDYAEEVVSLIFGCCAGWSVEHKCSSCFSLWIVLCENCKYSAAVESAKNTNWCLMV